MFFTVLIPLTIFFAIVLLLTQKYSFHQEPFYTIKIIATFGLGFTIVIGWLLLGILMPYSKDVKSISDFTFHKTPSLVIVSSGLETYTSTNIAVYSTIDTAKIVYHVEDKSPYGLPLQSYITTEYPR